MASSAISPLAISPPEDRVAMSLTNRVGHPNPMSPRERVDRIIHSWREGESVPNAHAVLEADPDIGAHPSLALDLAYEEFCISDEQGEAPDPVEFCARFPSAFQSELARLLVVHRWIEDHPQVLEDNKTQDWPVIGQQLGEYLILRELGRGAFSRVYLASESFGPSSVGLPVQPSGKETKAGQPRGGLSPPPSQSRPASRQGAPETTYQRPVVLKFSLNSSAEPNVISRMLHQGVVQVLRAFREPTTGLNLMVMPWKGCATLQDLLDHAYTAQTQHPLVDGGEGEEEEQEMDILLPGVPPTQTPGRQPPARAKSILEVAHGRGTDQDPIPPELPDPDPCLQEGTFTEGVLLLGKQMLEALVFLHERGVFHRDLKPTNVLLGFDGRPQLLDFNLSIDHTRPGSGVVGTLPYMPPEKIRSLLSGSRVDKHRAWALDSTNPNSSLGGSEPSTQSPQQETRADLYSLCIIFYELLTGRYPFGPLSPGLPDAVTALFLMDHQENGYQPVGELLPELDAGIARIIDQCLEFDPDRRPENAREVLEVFQRDLTHRRSAHQKSPRWRRLALLTGCSLGLLVLLTGVFAPRSSPQQVAPPPVKNPYTQGVTAFKEGKYQEAEFHLVKLESEENRSPQRRFALGVTRLHRIRHTTRVAERQQELAAGALQDFAMGARDPSLRGKSLACQAMCMTLLKNHAPAADRYRSALEEGYRTPEVLNNYAYALSRLSRNRERRDQIRDCLNEALELNPQLVAAHYNRALSLWNFNGKFPFSDKDLRARALQDIDFVIERLRPEQDRPELHLDAARLYTTASRLAPDRETKQKHAKKALTHLQRAIELGRPPQHIARNFLFARDLAKMPGWQQMLKTRRGKEPARQWDLRLVLPVTSLPN